MRTSGGLFVKIGTAFVTTVFALVSFSLSAQQQPSTTNQSNSPTAQQPSSEPAAPANSQGSSTATMSPVNGELVSTLDSKTAKAGDNVVVQTKESVKTADGTSIPTGSKLVGHVVGVQSSESGTNSQVALLFDHVELKGGQSLPVRSQIQSITPPSGAASTGASAAAPGSSTSSPSSPSGSNGGSAASNAPQTAGGSPAAEARRPAPGIVVAQNGAINISTTSVPGVLLANNAPGQQDPRMTRASSILLGAKQDVQLASGTQVVVGLSVAGGGSQ